MKEVAPGIMLFESEKSGPRRLYSAGVHGNEVEAQHALREVVRNFESGNFIVGSGSVMIVFANLEAMKGDSRTSPDGCDFNRSFHMNSHPRIVEIKKILEDFKPTLHRDLHCTIQSTPFPFALCSRPNKLTAEDFSEFAARYQLENIVQFVYKKDRELTTFAGFTAQHFGAESFTIELGQIGSNATKEIIPKIATSIVDEIVVAPNIKMNAKLQLWKMGKKIIKKTEDFYMAQDYKNFYKLKDGEVVATDSEDTYIAPKNAFILFPNSRVPVGGRGGVFVRKIIP